MTQEYTAGEMQEQGIDAYRAGEYEEALEAFEQARKLAAEAGDRETEVEALGSLGVVHVELERWDDAHQFLDQALDVCDETGDQINKGKVLGNLGMMYARQGDEENAAEAYEQAIAIFQDLGESGYEKDIARQLSKLKFKKGSFLDALGSYREGLEDGEEATGTQRMARKLFRLFGRLSGSAPIEEDEGDVIDVLPEPDEE